MKPTPAHRVRGRSSLDRPGDHPHDRSTAAAVNAFLTHARAWVAAGDH